MSGVEIVWEEPPISQRLRQDSRLTLFAQALREQPGRWAVWPSEKSSGVQTRLKQGAYTAFRPPEQFEAIWRSGKTYVRYIGEGTS